MKAAHRSALLRCMQTLICLTVIGSSGVLRAQDAASVRRLGSVYIGGGGFAGADPFFGRGDLARFTPGSDLLGRDLTDHTFDKDGWLSGEGSFDLALGFFPCVKAGRNGPELRLGMIYGSGPSLGGRLSRTTYTPYDTLTSSQTGQQTVIDSVNRSEYRVRYASERLGLNGSLIWRRPGRWSLYGGAGIMGGVLMNAQTTVTHEVDVYTDGGYSYPWSNGDHDFDHVPEERESFRNGTGWWLGAYVPLGLDWRAATVSPFWSRVHFCYELRPQIIMQNIPELPTATGAGMQALFLARVEL